jgi:hypothetical protein
MPDFSWFPVGTRGPNSLCLLEFLGVFARKRKIHIFKDKTKIFDYENTRNQDEALAHQCWLCRCCCCPVKSNWSSHLPEFPATIPPLEKLLLLAALIHLNILDTNLAVLYNCIP